jgi:hypothetical protein
VCVEDVLKELEDIDLIEEATERGLLKRGREAAPENKLEFKRFLCDILEISYHSDAEIILNEIKNRI